MNNSLGENLIYGISEKDDGSMKLFLDSKEANLENRERFFKRNSIDKKNVVSAEIKNSFKIKRVTKKDKDSIAKDCDGLISNSKNIFLSTTVADCVPIFFYDTSRSVIGIAHAGWRGINGGIVNGMLGKFKNEFNSLLKDVKIFIGPSIKECHFEVKEDVAREFLEYKTAIVKKNSKTYINLSRVIRDQLLSNRISAKNIFISDECTYCEKEKYFSFRRDKRTPIDAMIAYIGLK